jgi:hypothetical protein
LAATAILAVGAVILITATSSQGVARQDFIAYWATGQALIHHGNPYGDADILSREKSAGFPGSRPFFMRNPPYGLFLAAPFGLVSAKTAAMLWQVALAAALLMSVRLLWLMHGRPADRLHLIAYVFPPTIVCLYQGQLGLILLLGVVLFLRFHLTKPFLAGAALLLCSLKPHLFLPCLVVFAGWALVSRAYRVVAGFAVALFFALGTGFVLDPRGWAHYLQMATTERVRGDFVPTLSLFFRLAIHPQAMALQFLPAAIGCAWAAWYFWTRRDRWDWMTHGSILLLVSLMVAPYAWFVDETIVLPAILAGLYYASDRGRSLIPFAVLAGAALVEVMVVVPIDSGFYVWTTPAWLLWHLWATRGSSAL